MHSVDINATELPTRVLVAGASGATGRHLVAYLASKGVPQIYALVRDPTSPDFLRSKVGRELGAMANVHLLECRDLADAASVAAVFEEAGELGGVPEAVVSTCGPRSATKADGGGGEVYAQAIRNLVDAASRAGCKRFVYMSSANVTRPYSPIAIMLNSVAGTVLGWHAVVEDAVRVAAKGTPGMDYVIVRGGGLDHGRPGDGLHVTQGDRLKGGSVRRSRVAELLGETLRTGNVGRRSGPGAVEDIAGDEERGGGVTLEVGGCKANDSGADPNTNAPLTAAEWHGMLGGLHGDPVWESLTAPSKKDHLEAHRGAVCCCRSFCAVCCAVLVLAIVMGILAGQRVLVV